MIKMTKNRNPPFLLYKNHYIKINNTNIKNDIDINASGHNGQKLIN